jgi:PAS domain S-box-containing protein/diguanylate cyclase (GGDEF)-like protein
MVRSARHEGGGDDTTSGEQAAAEDTGLPSGLPAALQQWAETTRLALRGAALVVYLQRGDEGERRVAATGSSAALRRLTDPDHQPRRDRRWWSPRAATGERSARREFRTSDGEIAGHLTVVLATTSAGDPFDQVPDAVADTVAVQPAEDDRIGASEAAAGPAFDLALGAAVLLVENAILHDDLRAVRELAAQHNDRARSFELAYDTAFEDSVIGMAMVSLAAGTAGRYLRVNDALCRLTGYRAEELRERTFSDLTLPEDRGLDESALRRAMAGRRTPFRTDKRYLRADGEAVWVRVTANPVFDDDGTPLYALSQIEELNARRDHDAEQAAQVDGLTGLLHERAFEATLTEVIDRARRRGTPGGLYVAEIADWDAITAAHGQSVTDELQRRAADRLRTVLRGDDPISRLATNEFGFFAEDLSQQDAENLARRVNAALDRPEFINGTEFRLRAHLGMVQLTRESGDAGVMLHRARAALVAARGSDGTHVLYARPAEEETPASQVLYLNPDWDRPR